MELELRSFDGCPNCRTADERLHRALPAAGRTAVDAETGATGPPSVSQLTRAIRR